MKPLLLMLCLVLSLPVLQCQNLRQPGQLSGPYVPLSPADKLKFHMVELVEPQVFTGAALASAAEQLGHIPREWGQGVGGFARRYASTLGTIAVKQSLAFGLEAALREDPRYFPLDGAPGKARLWNALKQTFVVKTDSGASTFAYGRITADLATAQLVRLWLPPSDNSLGHGFRSGGISIGVDAAVNVLYEFFPRTRPK